MTQKTTRLLPDTREVRPCVVKTTHSMGSKGIFIIKNDEDEAEFEKFLEDSGNPTFVVTDFVDIQRNVACHFWMHPNGHDVVWFGSNENKRKPDGSFSTDSYLYMDEQEKLKRMQVRMPGNNGDFCVYDTARVFSSLSSFPPASLRRRGRSVLQQPELLGILRHRRTLRFAEPRIFG